MRNYAIQIHPRTKLQFASFAQNHPTNQPTWVRPNFFLPSFSFQEFCQVDTRVNQGSICQLLLPAKNLR